MRFKSVTAHAFGPFRNRTLRFAPGLMVIYGPNEAGKSSWHAALFAALCGQKRGRGRGRKEDQEFRDRHRPWTGSEWAVSTVVELEDGRRVVIHQNLENKVDCRAVDDELGRDCSAEIIGDADGVPDGARWLGLERDSFLATACIRQSDLLGVRDQADHLQEYLQRAATQTRGTSTAAGAIDRVETFLKENVGSERANAVGPLRAGLNRVAECREVLRRAHDARDEYRDLLDARERQDAAVREADRQLRLFQARRANADSDSIRLLLKEAEQLAERFPDGGPSDASADEQLRDAVNSVLTRWDTRPVEPPLVGEAAAELEARIAALPARPEGDLELHQTVVDAKRVHDDAVRDLAAYDRFRHGAVNDSARAPGKLPLLVGAVALVVGSGAILAGLHLPGALVVVLGLATAAWLTWQSRVRALGDGQRTESGGGRQSHWEDQRRRLEAVRDTAAASLAIVLRERGIEVADDVGVALEAYESACRRRAQQAVQASRRSELTERLAARLALEQQAAVVRHKRAEVEQQLRLVADRCGVAAEDDEGLAAALRRWQNSQSTLRVERSQAQKDWVRFQTLLNGKTVGEIKAMADRTARSAAELWEGLDPEEVANIVLADDLQVHEQDLRNTATRCREELNRLIGLIEGRNLRSVAEAEEDLAAAEEDLAQVRQQQRTLELTLNFLKQAESRVHRDIAPVLAGSVRRSLSRVTAGRYTDVRVDPTTLDVTVHDWSGHSRRASLLSHGTAEQIYLLLRVAMAEHLTCRDEVCPLILDDVTAHCDEDRRDRVLSVLHEVSRNRQVILFSQDRDIRDWGRGHAKEPADKIIELDCVAVPV